MLYHFLGTIKIKIYLTITNNFLKIHFLYDNLKCNIPIFISSQLKKCYSLLSKIIKLVSRWIKIFKLELYSCWKVESESYSFMSDSLRPHGFLQARIREWVAIPFSMGSSQHRDKIQVSRIAGRFFPWATREAQYSC